jgi:hypothetical protein
VIALAGKLCHALCIFTDFTTVFVLVGGNAVAGWVCAFIHVGHFITSARVGCAIWRCGYEKSSLKPQISPVRYACFVSGHDFSRATTHAKMIRALAPAISKMQGLKPNIVSNRSGTTKVVPDTKQAQCSGEICGFN